MAAPTFDLHSSLIYAMVTAKMPGVSTPCRNRQNRSCGRFWAKAAISVGITSSRVAGTITCLRPWRSAMSPTNGAASATAMVAALTTRPAPAAEI